MIETDAALNERDYGDLAGMTRAEAEARFGPGQVRRWRRGYADTPRGGESLRDVAARVTPAFLRWILPSLLRGEAVLVVAHGNSLRALVMALEDVSPRDVEALEIEVGTVISYDVAADGAFSLQRHTVERLYANDDWTCARIGAPVATSS